jgi:hypothetical protein
MEKLRHILKEPLTLEDIENYYEKTKSNIIEVKLTVSGDELHVDRNTFIAKLSMLITGTKSLYDIEYTLFKVLDNNKVVIKVTGDISSFSKIIEQRKIEAINQKEIETFQDEMIENFKKNKIVDHNEYCIKIIITGDQRSIYEHKINNIIDDNFTTLNPNSNYNASVVVKPIWVTFENISKDVNIEKTSDKPDNMKGVVEFIGICEETNGFIFRVYKESEICYIDWYNIIQKVDKKIFLTEDNKPSYKWECTIPAIQKGTYEVELITNTFFSFYSGKIEEYEGVHGKQKLRIARKKKARIFKVVPILTEIVDVDLYESFRENLKYLIGNVDFLENGFIYDAWILLPSASFSENVTKGKLKLLGFCKNDYPIFMSNDLSMDKITKMFIGGKNDYYEMYLDRLTSLLRKEGFVIHEITQM